MRVNQIRYQLRQVFIIIFPEVKMKTMISHYGRAVLFLLFFFLWTQTFAQEKRALLIGINTYAPDKKTAEAKGSGWHNLSGALNDVDAMKAVLLIPSFGFERSNIAILKEEQASREGIIRGLNDFYLSCQPGDIVFFYFSGHGSKVKNSLAGPEEGFKDGAIVPYDAIDGAKYIRDKELMPVFNKMLDKGVSLTIVYDCCYSGSLARGFPSADPPVQKALPMDTADVKDPGVVNPLPAERGALIISASLSNQPAEELQAGDDNLPHGLFTNAFIRALRENGPCIPANDMLTKISAIVKFAGRGQLPDLDCTTERAKQGIFGKTCNDNHSHAIVAVSYINTKDGTLELNGGRAMGFQAGTRFRHCAKPWVEIEITKLDGLASSTAVMIKGDREEIVPGDLFEPISWGMPERPNLYVWIPPDELSFAEDTAIATTLERYVTGNNMKWITNPDKEHVTHYIYYTNEGWVLADNESNKTLIGKDFRITKIYGHLEPGKSAIYLNIPPFTGLLGNLRIGKGTCNDMIDISEPGMAEYCLAGRWQNGRLEYTWAIPGISVKDSLYPVIMPVTARWLPANTENLDKTAFGDSLTVYAVRLGKIRAWLTLPPPADRGNFPYSIAMMKTTGNKTITTGIVREGEEYNFVLVKNENKAQGWDSTQRYVYIFTIDASGKRTLCYPQGGGGENLLPFDVKKPPDYIRLNVTWEITEPFGHDTYFMLTTDKPVTNPRYIFDEEGVRGSPGPGADDLSMFLDKVGVPEKPVSRGLGPSNWSMEKMTVESVGR